MTQHESVRNFCKSGVAAAGKKGPKRVGPRTANDQRGPPNVASVRVVRAAGQGIVCTQATNMACNALRCARLLQLNI